MGMKTLQVRDEAMIPNKPDKNHAWNGERASQVLSEKLRHDFQPPEFEVTSCTGSNIDEGVVRALKFFVE